MFCGLVGFLASFILTTETFKALHNPNYVPACNINPILSCGSVMKTQQAEIFGFPNSILGIAAFSAATTFGLSLAAGLGFKKRLRQLAQVTALGAVILVHWLIYESLYRIGSLCPFCVVVWMVTVPIFWYLTLSNLRFTKFSSHKIYVFINRHHGDILLSWYLIIVCLILKRFWYYWSNF